MLPTCSPPAVAAIDLPTAKPDDSPESPNVAPGLPPSAPDESLEQTLLRVLRRRWWVVFGPALLAGVAGAAAAWHFLPAPYTAQAVLHIASQPTRGLFQN